MLKRSWRLLFVDYKAKACEYIALKNIIHRLNKYSGNRVDYVSYWQYIRALYGVDDVRELKNAQWRDIYAELANADMADSQLDRLIYNIKQRNWIADLKE